eukprot:186280-Chlamydomonas_euryale.AAC.1
MRQREAATAGEAAAAELRPRSFLVAPGARRQRRRAPLRRAQICGGCWAALLSGSEHYCKSVTAYYMASKHAGLHSKYDRRMIDWPLCNRPRCTPLMDNTPYDVWPYW